MASALEQLSVVRQYACFSLVGFPFHSRYQMGNPIIS